MRHYDIERRAFRSYMNLGPPLPVPPGEAQAIREASRLYGIALCDYHAKNTTGSTRAAHLAMANELRGHKQRAKRKPLVPQPAAEAFKEILNSTAARSGVPATRILREDRTRAVYIARVAVYCRALAAGLTPEQIGVLVRRDGSSVRHGIKRAREMAPCYPKLAELLAA